MIIRQGHLNLIEKCGAVDGTRNRYFMSSGGVWCPATAGTRLAPSVSLCQAGVEALA